MRLKNVFPTKKRCATLRRRPTASFWCRRLSSNEPAFLLRVPSPMLNQLTLSELTGRLARREVSSREIVQACLDRIRAVDDRVHAFLSYDAEEALAQADAADKALAAGASHQQQPLLGIPISVKDLLAVK